MDFYELLEPDYESDFEMERLNPISIEGRFFLPSMNCRSCGNWASSSRIWGDFPIEFLANFRGVSFVSDVEWKKNVGSWAKELGVRVDVLSPGSQIGRPVVKLSSEILEDTLHPMPGQIVVGERVVSILRGANVSGVSFFPLIPEYFESTKSFCAAPKLYELVIGGTGWRVGVDESRIISCNVCNRNIFPKAPMVIDENRWDGSDFFHVDKNPNRIFVSEVVAKVFEVEDISNARLIRLS